MADDIAFAFASELAPDQYIDDGIVRSWIEVEKCGGPNKDSFFAASVSRNDDVSYLCKPLNLALGPVSFQSLVIEGLVAIAIAFPVSPLKLFFWCSQMYMMDIRAVSLPNSVDLSTNANCVNYVKTSCCFAPTMSVNHSLECLANPRSTILAIKSLTCSLESSSLGFGSG